MRTVAVLMLVLMVVVSCGAALAAEEAYPWTDKPFLESGENFHFAIVSDNTGGMREGVFASAMGKLNLLRPEFVMSIGDFIEGYTEDAEQLEREWGEFAAMADELKMRMYLVAGNHDESNKVQWADWEKRFGRHYYHFVYKNVLFLCLDTQDGEYVDGHYSSAISDAQVEYVGEALEANSNARWTFVFMHQPLWVRDTYGDTGWEKIEALLADRPHTVFGGHWHTYAKYDVNGRDYIVLGTTGGESELRGAHLGEFDHVLWVTMTGEEPVLANLTLDGILPGDVSTAESASAYWVVLYGTPVWAESVVSEEAEVESIEAGVKFVNRSYIEMTVEAEVSAPEGLSAEPRVIRSVVAPRSEERVAVLLEAAEPVDAASVGPVEVEWKATLAIPGRETLTADGVARICVETLHELPRAKEAVTIDGDLSEWGALPFFMTEPAEVAPHGKEWAGPEDSLLKFAAASDDEYLYVAVEVSDDHMLLGLPDSNVRRQDGVTVLVDARPREERAEPSKDWAAYLHVLVNPGETVGAHRLAHEEAVPEGIKIASVRSDQGHNTEIAFPLAALAERGGAEVKDVRINIRLHDRDTAGAEGGCVMLWWRPNWLGAGNYADSGTFVLE